MKLKNIQALYWSNIKRFWKTSFYDYERAHSIFDKKRNELYSKKDRTIEEEIWYRLIKERDEVHSQKKAKFRSEVGPVPFWIFEFIFFIPNIILFPFIRTIIDVCTRTQQTKDSIDLLIKSLGNLLDSNPEGFDTLVEVLSFNECSNHHIFKSLNSQDLIADLHFARVEEQIKPQILQLLKDNSEFDKQEIDELFKLKSSRSLHNKYPLISSENKADYPSYPKTPKDMDTEEAGRNYFHGLSLLYRIIYNRDKSINQDYQKLRRNKQFQAIKDYLENPENNGSKLAQYFQVNVVNLQNNKSTREEDLKNKTKIECGRLEKLSTKRSLNKQKNIENVINSSPLDEKKLKQALLINGGFGFFGKMTSSFNNVYCTDIPIKRM